LQGAGHCEIRAVELVEKRAGGTVQPKVRAAPERFEATVPGAKAIRDRLEHFDEYESGRGNEQKRARINEPSRTWFTSQPGHHSVTVAIPGLPTLQIELQAAMRAANELQRDVGVAVDT